MSDVFPGLAVASRASKRWYLRLWHQRAHRGSSRSV